MFAADCRVCGCPLTLFAKESRFDCIRCRQRPGRLCLLPGCTRSGSHYCAGWCPEHASLGFTCAHPRCGRRVPIKYSRRLCWLHFEPPIRYRSDSRPRPLRTRPTPGPTQLALFADLFLKSAPTGEKRATR